MSTIRSLICQILVFLPLFGACSWDEARFKETRNLTAPWKENQALTVKTSNGSVEVVRTEGTEVSIIAELKATTEERLHSVRVVAEPRNDGALEISVHWPEGGRKGSEGCSFKVRSPGVRGLEVETKNGSIVARGLVGELRLRTSNGKVEVSDHDGPVDADTSNGSVIVERVRGPVKADTSNGAIRVQLGDDNPGPVDLESSNGSILLDVGPAFRGVLDLDTSNGALNLHVPDSVRTKKLKKTSATLDFGQVAPSSKAHTSNGSITVE